MTSRNDPSIATHTRSNKKKDILTTHIMKLIKINNDKLKGVLFSDEEKVHYKAWMAEYIHNEFHSYMKTLREEDLKWIPLAAIYSGYISWVTLDLLWKKDQEFRDKLYSNKITIYGVLGKQMSCHQLIILLQDYIPAFYFLDSIDINDPDYHGYISFEHVFIKTDLDLA